MKRGLCLLVLVVMSVGAGAQTEPLAISEVDRLRVQNALQAVEIAELRRQAAVAEAQRVIQSLQREGYTLDLERMIYVPVASDAAPEEATTSE